MARGRCMSRGAVGRFLFAGLTPGILMAQAAGSAWTTIEASARARCAFDASYRFWVRDGDATRVVLYLQGGGACWSAESCRPGRTIAFDAVIDSTDLHQREHGIFDRNNALNPFRDYTAVFVPYCTGDLHLGTRVSRYAGADSAASVTVHHAGYFNVSAVLDHLQARPIEPTHVTVIGGSAGGVASPVVAAEVARRFPGARVSQIADGASAFRVARLRELMTGWGTDSLLRSLGMPLAADGDLVVGLYRTAAARHPRLRFSQVATTADAVVGAWLQRFGGDASDVAPNIQETFRDLSATGVCFTGFALPGAQHTVLWRPDGLSADASGRPLGERLRREVIERDCPLRNEATADRGVRHGSVTQASARDAVFLFSYRAKPDMEGAFAAGYKRHLAWHAAHADSLAWLAWTVIDGPAAGTFVDGTFGIAFKAFDDRVDQQGDGEDAARNVTAFAVPTGRETLRLRRDLSAAVRLESARAGRMQKVARLTATPGTEAQVERVLRTMRAGAPKTLDYAVYERVSGGDQPAYTIIVQLDAWADLERGDPTAAIVRALGARLARVESEIWAYRPDLTYIPKPGG